MGVDMPLCSRRAWTTFQGPVDPSRLPTCPPQVATTTASSFHAFNPDTQAGRRRVFIMTTIQTQRPTLLYVSQFYPDKTRTTVPVLSRHSQHLTRHPSPSIAPSRASATRWTLAAATLLDVIGALSAKLGHRA